MRYVKNTLEFGLMYRKGGNFFLSSFSDTDLVDDINDQ